MSGDEAVAGVAGIIVTVIVWIANEIAENAITDACFQIIFDMSDYASQYDPTTGALIGVIPAVISGCIAFVAVEVFLKFLLRFE